MKKFLLTTAALLISAGAASAADLAARPYTKAPPPIVEPGINWSGFYIGAMGGYGWSDRLRGEIPALGLAGSISSDELNGGFGGGTIGYKPPAALSYGALRSTQPDRTSHDPKLSRRSASH
jgi:outer membrane immunogenic protein